MPLNSLGKVFFEKHLNLKEIGSTGQEKLLNSKVLIIGAGGLGNPVAEYLTASGVGTIGICDFDTVELSNLHRQPLFDFEDEKRSKVQVLREKLSKKNPFTKIEVFNDKLTAENIPQLLAGFDLVVDCTDHFPTKMLLHDGCFFFSKNLVQAAIFQFEGKIHNFYFSRKTKGPCFSCLWEIIPPIQATTNCQKDGVFGVVAGFIGMIQASEALKVLLDLAPLQQGESLVIDWDTYSTSRPSWKENSNCRLCQSKLPSQWRDFYQSHESFYRPDHKVFEKKMEEVKDYIWIDIRKEKEIGDSWGKLNQMGIGPRCLSSESFENISELLETFVNNSDNFVFFCQSGTRSLKFVEKLRSMGGENCFSLMGGIESCF